MDATADPARDRPLRRDPVLEGDGTGALVAHYMSRADEDHALTLRLMTALMLTIVAGLVIAGAIWASGTTRDVAGIATHVRRLAELERDAAEARLATWRRLDLHEDSLIWAHARVDAARAQLLDLLHALRVVTATGGCRTHLPAPVVPFAPEEMVCGGWVEAWRAPVRPVGSCGEW